MRVARSVRHRRGIPTRDWRSAASSIRPAILGLGPAGDEHDTDVESSVLSGRMPAGPDHESHPEPEREAIRERGARRSKSATMSLDRRLLGEPGLGRVSRHRGGVHGDSFVRAEAV